MSTSEIPNSWPFSMREKLSKIRSNTPELFVEVLRFLIPPVVCCHSPGLLRKLSRTEGVAYVYEIVFC